MVPANGVDCLCSGDVSGRDFGIDRNRFILTRRIITSSPDETKEAHWKRVPIHRDLVSDPEGRAEGPALMTGKVFPLRDRRGIREIGLETFKNVWPRACEK